MVDKVAIVTGGNRGIGFEVCRELAQQGYQTILTSRDPVKGKEAWQSLHDEKLPVHFHQLDVTSDSSIHELFNWIKQTYGRLDVLINNAGIYMDPRSHQEKAGLHTDLEAIRTSFETNTLGPYRMCQIFGPLIAHSGGGRIVNVSSGMGQLSDMQGGAPAYRISKTALNAATRIFAAELASGSVLVNSVCPGWVRTDMGGQSAPRSLKEGADTIVWLATLPNDGPTGSFFRDHKLIPW